MADADFRVLYHDNMLRPGADFRCAQSDADHGSMDLSVIDREIISDGELILENNEESGYQVFDRGLGAEIYRQANDACTCDDRTDIDAKVA